MNLQNKIAALNIVLGSGSPRRKQLLAEVGFHFEVRTKEIDETPPAGLHREEIAIRLSELKSQALQGSISENEILITADTIVCFHDQVLGKPKDHSEAFAMLKLLNGNTHQVYTGVSIYRTHLLKSFSIETNVEFNSMTDSMINEYIETYQPFDKAGSYGAQECLPSGMNPCSQIEIEFLNQIENKNLLSNTLFHDNKVNIPIIKNINGSYFNVMGLPIRELTLALIDE